MAKNKKKNAALLVASALLFLALFDGWQYGFFTILRFVVLAVTVYVAWLAYERQKEKWACLFGFIAILFNPFFPIYLDRETWIVIDFIVGLFLLAATFLFRLERKN